MAIPVTSTESHTFRRLKSARSFCTIGNANAVWTAAMIVRILYAIHRREVCCHRVCDGFDLCERFVLPLDAQIIKNQKKKTDHSAQERRVYRRFHGQTIQKEADGKDQGKHAASDNAPPLLFQVLEK